MLSTALSAAVFMAASAQAIADVPRNVGDLVGAFQNIDGLSTAQKQQMVALKNESDQQIAPRIRQIGSLKTQIAEILGGSAPIKFTELAPFLTQISAAFDQIEITYLSYTLQARALLSSEQLSKIIARYRQQPQIKLSVPAGATASVAPAIFMDTLQITRGVNFTEAQSAQLAALESAADIEIAAATQESEATARQLGDALNSAGPVTLEQLMPLQQQASVANAHLEKARLSPMVEVLALLTPTQRAQSVTLRAQIAELNRQEAALRKQALTAN